MFLAYLIYTFFPLFFFLYYKKIENKGFWGLLPLIVYSIIIGLRFNVGIDYIAYYKAYINPYLLDADSFEVGYIYLNKALIYLEAPPYLLFIICAFLQIYGVYYLAKDNIKVYKYAFLFYFLALSFFFALNVIRQSVAIGILLIAVKQIYNRNFLKYIFLVFLAILFHKSAIIFLPLYFIISRVKIDFKFSILFYIFSFIISSFVLEFLWDNFSLLAKITGYADRADSINSAISIDWSKTGANLGIYLWFVLDILTIYFYHKKFNLQQVNRQIRILYNLYLFGICFSNLVAGTYFDRIAQYFIIFKIFVFAHLFYYIFNENTSKNILVVKTILSVLFLVMIFFYYNAIYKHAGLCSPFQFID